ncbi:hypothetical protein BDW69DRAFT_196643 [Aspergillus filifer]
MGLGGLPLATARICIIIVPAFLLFGYNQSNLGGVLDYPSFTKHFPDIDTTSSEGAPKDHKSTVQGTVVAVYTLASSYSLKQLVVGRVISGIGNGGVNAIVPVWQSECRKTESRGKNVVIIGVFIARGIAVAGWVNGHREEAREAMMALTGREEPIEEIRDLQLASRQAPTSERGFLDLLKPGPQRLFYRLCLAIRINFCAQMTGANVILYYGKTISKESLGLQGVKASFLNGGVLTWKIFAASLAYLSVDQFGWKPLFIISCLGMGLSMAGLAGIVWAIEHRYTFGASVAATFFLFFYMTFFPLGFLYANFLYSAEIAPQDLRVHLAAVGTATHWLFNFVIAEITPVAFATIMYRYYIVYAVIGVCAAVFIYFFFPETKGRSLVEMDGLFLQPETWWRVTAYARVNRHSVPAPEEKEKDNVKHFEDFVSAVERLELL